MIFLPSKRFAVTPLLPEHVLASFHIAYAKRKVAKLILRLNSNAVFPEARAKNSVKTEICNLNGPLQTRSRLGADFKGFIYVSQHAHKDTLNGSKSCSRKQLKVYTVIQSAVLQILLHRSLLNDWIKNNSGFYAWKTHCYCA